MNFKSVRLLVFGLFLGFTILGCTRDKGPSGTVVLGIPNSSQKMSALGLTANDVLAHIVVNVRGDGIPGIITWSWDSNNGGGSTSVYNPPPPEIYMDVPAGGARLIQYLGVYENTQTKALTFYYGDVKQDVAPGSNNVVITAYNIGASSGQEHQVAGRYKSNATDGPTGKLAVMIRAPETQFPGRPPMKVMEQDIVGGWFSAFLVDNLAFQFVLLPDKIPLFELNPNIHLTTISQSQMKVYAPDHIRNGSDTERPYIIHLGFFGPGVTGNEKICYRNETGSISNMTKLDGSTAVTWDNSPTPGDPSSVIYRKGGTPHDHGTYGSACLDLDNPDTFLLEYAGLGNGMRDGMGLVGPFLTNFDAQAQNGLKFTFSAPNLTVDWKYLPGAFNSARPLTGVTVFTMPSGNNNNGGGGGDMPCDQNLMQRGFTPYTDVFAPTASTVIGGLSSQNDVAVGLCPFVDSQHGRHYLSSVIATGGGGGCSSCGNGPAEATQVQIKVAEGYTTINQSICFPVEVMGVDDSLNIGKFSGGETVSLSATNGSFYSDPGCGSPMPSINFGPGDYAYRFAFFNPTSSGADTLVADAVGGAITDGSQAINIGSNTSATLTNGVGLKVMGFTGAWYTHSCNAVLYYFVDSFGDPAPSSGSGSIYFDDAGASGTFYVDDGCQSTYGGGPHGFSANQTGFMYFYKNTVAADNSTVTFRGGDSGYSNVYGSVSYQIYNPGAPSQTYSFVDPGISHPQVQTGFCYPLTVVLKDDQHNPAPAPGGGKNYTVSIPGGVGQAELFTDPACTASAGSSYIGNIGVGLTEDTSVYIIPKVTNANIDVAGQGLTVENFTLFADRTKIMVTAGLPVTFSSCHFVDFELRTNGGAPIPGSVNVSNITIDGNVSATDSSTFGLGAASCSPLAGTQIYTVFSGSMNSTAYVQTDASGSFTFDLIPSGPWAGAIDSFSSVETWP